MTDHDYTFTDSLATASEWLPFFWYDRRTRELTVNIDNSDRSGDDLIYRYSEVPSSLWEDLVEWIDEDEESAGEYYNENIKGKFVSVRLGDYDDVLGKKVDYTERPAVGTPQAWTTSARNVTIGDGPDLNVQPSSVHISLKAPASVESAQWVVDYVVSGSRAKFNVSSDSALAALTEFTDLIERLGADAEVVGVNRV